MQVKNSISGRGSLQSKLLLLCAIPVIGLLLVSVVTLVQTWRMEETTANAINSESAFTQRVAEMTASVTLVAREARNVILADEYDRFMLAKDRLVNSRDSLQSQLAELAKLAKDRPALAGVIANITGQVNALLVNYSEILKQSELGEIQTATLILLTKVDTAEQALDLELTKLTANAKGLMNEVLANSRATLEKTIAVTGVLGLLMAAVCASVAWWIGRGLRAQIGGEPNEAMRVVNAIAQGDLRVKIAPAPDNSILNSIANLRDRLANIISQTKKATAQIDSASTEMLSLSTSVLDATARQSDAASGTASNVEEMVSSAQSVAEYASATRSQALESQSKAAQGAEQMSGLMGTLEKMAQRMQSSNSEITQLADKSDRINGIVQVIEGIAEQTNLLALNAAIEAARAGESGRGFAVVADEVRNLAQNTANATGEIRGLIADICASSERSKVTVSEATEQVVSTRSRAEVLNDDLRLIVQNLMESVSNTEAVANSTEEQQRASQDIEQKICDISRMSEKLGHSSQDLENKARQLSALASGLENAVSYFKTA